MQVILPPRRSRLECISQRYKGYLFVGARKWRLNGVHAGQFKFRLSVIQTSKEGWLLWNYRGSTQHNQFLSIFFKYYFWMVQKQFTCSSSASGLVWFVPSFTTDNQLISLHLYCWTGGMHESYLGVEFRIHLSRVHLLDLALGSLIPFWFGVKKSKLDSQRDQLVRDHFLRSLRTRIHADALVL